MRDRYCSRAAVQLHRAPLKALAFALHPPGGGGGVFPLALAPPPPPPCRGVLALSPPAPSFSACGSWPLGCPPLPMCVGLMEYPTACATNTPVRTVFFEDFVVRWTRVWGGGGGSYVWKPKLKALPRAIQAPEPFQWVQRRSGCRDIHRTDITPGGGGGGGRGLSMVAPGSPSHPPTHVRSSPPAVMSPHKRSTGGTGGQGKAARRRPSLGQGAPSHSRENRFDI